MGATFCVGSFWTFDMSNLIDLLGMVVNVLLTIWIVTTIQDRQSNRRVLKDHYIERLIRIQSDYEIFFSRAYAGELVPAETLHWFKLENIRINNLLKFLCTNYQIDHHHLHPYQIDLNRIIVDDPAFTASYNTNNRIIFSGNSKQKLMKFQESNESLFLEMIEKINGY
jgi:hypothetical protein